MADRKLFDVAARRLKPGRRRGARRAPTVPELTEVAMSPFADLDDAKVKDGPVKHVALLPPFW